MIKALACDIDGTITDEKRRLDLKAVDLLRKIEGMGVPVVLATGNVLCVTRAASTYIGTTGPLIAENGGVIKLPMDKEPVYLCDTDKNELREAAAHLRKTLPVRDASNPDLRKTEFSFHKNVSVGAVKEALKGFHVRIVDTKFAIHVTEPNVNKGRALEEVAKLMGLKLGEFAALGDSENDFEMLQKAGLGVSVGEERLKTAADFVTKESFAKGGVSALEYIIKKIKKH